MLHIKELRCEYIKDPIGIDIKIPRLSWQIQSARKNVLQSAYQIQVCMEDDSFAELLWDSGRVQSDQSIHAEYRGPSLKSRKRYYYRVRVWDQKGNQSDWSSKAFWEMGILSPGEWQADWITPLEEEDASESRPCPMLRRSFEVRDKVKKARIYATCLGLYELHLNGERVGDYLLTPGWTSYNKRLQYQTYDVTDMLKTGTNAVGAVLGDGWYKGNLTWGDRRNLYGDKSALLFEMHIVYEDGREEVVISDSGWKWSTGPILMSEIYHGETYDARLKKNGWSTACYDDKEWSAVKMLEYTKENLVAQESVPIRKIQEIQPVEILRTPAGETVIDMGQNMVGWIRLAVEGPEGTRVTLQHAEVLDKEGNFYIDNLRSARQTIQYILKGEGKEVFEPHFTFQGFRYVKVEGYPGRIDPESFIGVVIHSDMEQTGHFECSDEMINKLQHNILWGQKGNFVDVPTDCPQRDERLGWTGDAQVFIRTACFNMNVAPFFTKWLKDLKADQHENGGMPHVIPDVLGKEQHSSAAWGDAAVICPWTLYLCYGDTRVLEQQYESMKAWVEYNHNQAENETLRTTGFHYGDWLALDSKEGSYVGATSKDYIATAFYAYSTGILAKTARILNKEQDALEYEVLHQRIIDSFRKEFVTPNGRLAVPTQTAYVLALMFDLVDKKDRKRTVDTLVGYLKDNNYHLTTGFVGTPYLCHVLTENGYNDIAYKLVQQRDYPSWLYQITKGATTIWEHWDGIKEDGSFWSKDMNSFNHYAYGSIGDWMYQVMAGIDLDENKPGYKHIIINPQPGEGISYAKASFNSAYGEISSSWEKKDGKMHMEVIIPPNTTASVTLPLASLESLQVDSMNVQNAEGIIECVQELAAVKLEIGSGRYSFLY